MKRLNNFNDDYFDCIDSEEKAYFLGFISADGCIVERTKISKLLSIHINRQDIKILEKFKTAICFTGNIFLCKSKSEMCNIFCYSVKMVNDLSKYGVVPRKTKILKFPELPEHLIKHYMRGYFDGDGCISIHKDKRFNNGDRGQVNIVSASFDFINEYINLLVKNAGVKRNNILDRKGDGSYYVIDWAGLADVENIYHFLYDNATIFLDRKKEKFDKVMAINSLKIRYRKIKQLERKINK